MAQIKIYGNKSSLDKIKAALSDVIHSCAVEALKLPADKRFHRFLPLDPGDFYYPAGRTEQYIIIEISLMEGRSVETKKRLIKLLFQQINAGLGISEQDIEITITETPRHNWGIRGRCGDELELNYKLEV